MRQIWAEYKTLYDFTIKTLIDPKKQTFDEYIIEGMERTFDDEFVEDCFFLYTNHFETSSSDN